MHLIFERSNGRFRSNCNILALAWMPYYTETKFRQALLEYHQKQLISLGHSAHQTHGTLSNEQEAPNIRSSNGTSGNNSSHHPGHQDLNRINLDQQQSNISQLVNSKQFLNSRLAELYQRYLYIKTNKGKRSNENTRRSDQCGSATAISNELDTKYGRMPEFGWLVLGNVGKTVGVTLTTIIQPPQEIDGRQSQDQTAKGQEEEDLMVFCDDDNTINEVNTNDVFDKQSETAHSSRLHSSEFNRLRPDKRSIRQNYNLRGHLDDIILARWNELYQKLATVDSKGNVLIWCKINEKFTIQTPFYNRTKSVADFRWSNDGKTALICYTDSFILIGSSSSQRHWHSMLNLEDYHITCASWTPNDDQLLLGVSNGNIVVIDLPQSELTELVVGQVNIRTLCWSSYEMNLYNIKNIPVSNDSRGESGRRSNRSSLGRNSTATTIVNQRRLSRDCSVFSRYRFCSQGPISQNSDHQSTMINPGQWTGKPYDDGQCNILAIDFANNTIKLYANGLEDQAPICIQVNLESYIMAWSSDGQILAVAGFNIYTSAPSIGCLRCRYSNAIKFYNQQGVLIYEYVMKYTRYPITAFTWAHNDRRIFIATGPRLHCAKVYFDQSLDLLSLSCIQRYTKLADKIDTLEGLLRGQTGLNVLSWQSFNCPIDLNKKPTLISSNSSASSSGKSTSFTDDSGNDLNGMLGLINNANVLKFEAPAKLKFKIDEMFRQTIRQPIDEQFTLNDVAWHVPKNQQRYYCTLVCYASDQMDKNIGAIGHQYRSDLMDQNSDIHSASDQYKIFVLYMEFQGSLIPILRARRVGFLKPEFVIFDPEDNNNRALQRHHKVSDISNQVCLNNFIKKLPSNQPTEPNSLSYDFNQHAYAKNCSELHGDNNRKPSGSGSSTSRQSLSDAEHYYNFDQCDFVKEQKSLANSMKKRDKGSASNQTVLGDPYLEYLLNLGQLKSAKKHQQARESLLELYRTTTKSSSNTRTLPETNELVRIRSNIWGTRFKIINVTNRMIKHRAILGRVVYKASILHLQPRQIFLNVKDMTNYCVLCSSHHHTKSSSSSQRTKLQASKQTCQAAQNSRNSNSISLIDMPNTGLEFKTPSRRFHAGNGNSSGRGSRHRHNHNDINDKVVLTVGDAIRIAPKLEHNQRFGSSAGNPTLMIDNQRPSTSRGHSKGSPMNNCSLKHHAANSKSRMRHPSSLNHSKLISQTKSSNETSIECQQHSSMGASTAAASRLKGSRRERDPPASQQPDDILTLSLDQGDQVRVEMSSLKAVGVKQQHDPNSEAFLEANKTLKSIQTITRMIVDLSSKVNDDDDGDDAGRDGANNLVGCDTQEQVAHSSHNEMNSPNKIIKLSNNDISSRYIPPETPVHRPRKPSRLAREFNKTNSFQQTQSATTTPLRLSSRRSTHNRRRKSIEKDDDINMNPLPAPPPSVPFGRRISASAKRFFDGSLRSLYGHSGSGYSTCDDLEPEECEPLVSGRGALSFSRPNTRANMLTTSSSSSKPTVSSRGRRGQSQPSTPAERSKWSSSGGKDSIDLVSLRELLMRKISKTGTSRRFDGDRLTNQQPASLDTKSRGWLFRDRSSLSELGRARRDPLKSDSIIDLSSSSSSSLSSPSSSSPSSSSSLSYSNSSSFSDSSSEEDGDGAHDKKSNRNKGRKLATKTGKITTRYSSSSARNLNDLEETTRRLEGSGRKGQKANRKRRRRHARKSLCQNSNCCCGREFKLKNRPPVWNELSQVYQLDFGGRVTQESAKNLQIDFEGNLALQFGRIDRCTYTLDYKYPFNAVQALAIALASLTQRLK